MADETSAFPGGCGCEVVFKTGRRDVGVPRGDVFFVFTPSREAGLQGRRQTVFFFTCGTAANFFQKP